MSIGPLPSVNPLAGAPLAQLKGSELERAGQDSAAHQRRVQADAKAADAAGIGATDGENTRSEERDADGRRLWEFNDANTSEHDSAAAATSPHQGRDATGDCGSQLDVSV